MDPLRPFANIVRTMLTQKVNKTAPVDRPQDLRRSDQKPPELVDKSRNNENPLEEMLRARLAQVEPATAELRQRIFVEVALIHELGDTIAQSTDFRAITEEITSQIAAHPELQGRLAVLLQSLSTKEARLTDST